MCDTHSAGITNLVYPSSRMRLPNTAWMSGFSGKNQTSANEKDRPRTDGENDGDGGAEKTVGEGGGEVAGGAGGG